MHLLRCLLIVIICAIPALHAADGDITRFADWLRGPAATIGGPAGERLVQAEEERGQELAMARRAKLKELMRTRPELALKAALPQAEIERLPASIRQHLERRVSGLGRLLVACEMPAFADHDHDDPNHVCEAKLVRQLEIDGQSYEAYAAGLWREAMTGTYQVADALVLDGAAVVGGGEPTAVAAPAADGGATAGAPTGDLPTNELLPRKVLYIIARFADEDNTVTVKSDASAISEMTVTSNFFRENTNDRMYFIADKGDTAGGALMDIVRVQLPSNASAYTNAFSTLLGDARSAASALGYTYTNYNFDATITTNKGGFSYAGKAWLGSQGTHCRNDYSSLRTMGHELGHNIMFNHAYYWRTDATEPFGMDSRPGGYVGDTDLTEPIEYGHYFSIMSAQSSGEMNDATKPHFTAMEKARAGWLPIGTNSSSKTQAVSTSGTYRIYRHDVKAQTATPRGIRIESPATIYTGSTAYKYWLDYRYAPWSSVTGQVRSGLNIDATTGSYPIQLDMTPFSNDDTSGNSWTDDNNDKRDGQLRLGRTYSDPGGAIHITPVARDASVAGEEYIDVVINLGSFSGNRAPSITATTQSATAVATNAAVNFGVTASDPDGDQLAYDWLFEPVSGHIESGLNTTTASASWATAGQYKVRVTVSDMKGGRASHTFLTTVGSPASTGRIAGRVLWGGRPVANARVAIGTTGTWTDVDGGYLLSGLSAASHTLSCRKDGMTFTAQFTNPVALAAGEYAIGKDWHANEPYPDPGSATTYTVSGTVTDAGSGMSGVVISLAGKSTTSAANGSWSVSGVPNGTWPVTAWTPNASFGAVSATVNGANVTGIALSRTRYTISGDVVVAAQGIAVTVRAGSYSVSGNSTRQGNTNKFAYTLSVPAGSYTVTPSAAGYTFAPNGFTNPVNATSGNASGINFSYTTTATKYLIRGTVTVNGIPVQGASVATTGASAVTGPDGAYALYVGAGTYTVTPSISGGTFTPASRSVTVGTADVTAQDFALNDAAPTVATAAAASPATVATPTGSTTLTVLGADNLAESTLTYTWSATTAPFPVGFSANGTNAAKSTIATFQGPGTYTFTVRIRDSRQQSVSSTVGVNVQSNAGSTTVTVSPYRSEMIFGETRQFTATGWNSAGSIISITPVWTTTGGTIDSAGLYQATAAGSTYTVTATAGGGSGNAFVTVTGTAEPTASIAASDATASEPGLGLGNGAFTITRNIGTGAVTIGYVVTGTATAGSDYTTLSGSVSMADGVTSATVTVAPLDDALVEAHETVILTLQPGTGYQVGGTASATVTIKDDEAPTVSISATDNSAAEPGATGGNGVFTLTRAGNPDAALTVNLALAGTATTGADFTGIGGTATIAAGGTSTVLTLTPVDDAVAEETETAILTVASGSGYTPGSPASATVSILDDEAPALTVAVTDADCAEASSNDGVFTITRLGLRSTSFTANYTLAGTAVNGTDYTSRTGTVSFGANAGTATVSIDPIDDTAYEGPETAIVTVTAGTGYSVGSPSGATITIVDNDKPTVSIAATDDAASEAGGTATFTVSRTGITSLGDLTVLYTITGTATAGGDYQTLSGSVVIPQNQGSATITVVPIQDAMVEVPETIIVTLAANAAYTIATSPGNAATATIVDDTETPMLTIATGDNAASEPGQGSGTGTVIITRAGNPGVALNAVLAVSGTATNGTDYTAIASPFAIAAGTTAATITVTPVDDSIAERDETVVVALQSGTGYTLGTSTSATVNLYCDESPQVAVEVVDGDCAEPSNGGSFLLRRYGLRTAALTVNLTRTGTATGGTDYTAIAATATIGANSGASSNINVSPIDDTAVEGVETVILTVASGTGYAVGSPASATIDLRDNDGVSVSVSASANAGEPSSNGSFTITRSAASASTLTVNYTLSGTATNGADFQSLSGSVTIAANATSATVPVTVIDDSAVEGSETVVLTIAANGTAYTIGTTSRSLTITDNDAPTITLAASDASATEGADTGAFTLTAAPAPSANLTVSYTVGGSATNGVDFTALAGTATILAGQTTATVTVTPVDDQLGEGAETVQLTLAAGAGYNIGTTGSQTVTITASDTPVASIIATDPAAGEPADTGRFTVSLSNPGSANTTVSYAVGGTATGGTDYTALTGTVSVSAGATSANITVTPIDDGAVEGSETVSATVVAGTGYTVGSPASATVDIADDDSATTQAIVLSPSAGSVPEGGTAIFTVRLQIAPTSDVMIAVARTAGDSDISVSSGSSLTFTSANWSTPQTVTLAAAQDADLANGQATITASATGLASVAHTATEADDDTQGFVLSATTVSVPEGGTATVTVALAFQPAATTTVTVARTSGDSDLTVQSGASLTFTTANWATPQTVTLAAAQDGDLAAGSATITVSASGATSATLTATEVDDDSQALQISTTAVSVAEGGSATFTVRLAYQPLADTSVAVARTGGDTDIAVGGGASLTFTTANWATPQTVTLTATEDADAANGQATITVSSTGVSSQTVVATETDNDTLAVVVSPASVTVAEGGTATFTVALGAQPAASTTLTVARTAGDSDLTVQSGASLTFTTTNWATPQTVTLAAAEDADAANGAATITVSGTGVTSGTVTATEADNDTQALVVSTASVSVPEGSTAGFTVRLAAQPTANTTVSVTRTAGDTDVTVQSGASLTFTTANWDTPQSVTLAAAEDADTTNGGATITVAATGLASQAVAATEADNDTQAFQVSATSVSVPEGSTATFTVRLAYQPAVSTTVTVSRTAGDGDLAVTGGASLTFTTANWATPQTVTLAAAEDADTTNGSATITVAATGITSQAVAATEADNDTQALVVSAAGLTVPEGSSATFTVRLAYQPATDTTVTVAQTAGDADLTVSGGASLNFTTVNWATPQTVTLSAGEDADTTNGTASITVSSSGLTSQTVTATEADNDVLALQLSATSVTVAEGSTATFTVRLSAAPAGDTTVTVANSAGDADITVSSGASLTFTTANWATPQTVTLAAAQDADTANGIATITVSAAGLTSLAVQATEADDDTQALVVSTTAATVAEGSTATFTVRLAFQPAATTTVTVARTAGDSDLSVSAGGTLTFTTANWDTAQTVTLAAAEDADTANGSATIAVSASGLTTQTVTATEADNDTLAIQISATTATVPEGGTATVTVRLTAQPAGDTVVSVARTSGDSDLMVSSGASLTFTTANWSAAQTVTLAAAEDADAANGTAAISVTAGGLTTQTVSATEADNDTLALVVSSTAVTVAEGSTATFTVRLAAQPAGDTVVTVANSTGDADITVPLGASLTFTTANWATPQTVTLAAAQDADTTNGSAAIAVSAAGLTTQNVAAAEADDDSQSLILSTASVSVPEGSTATFTVRLAFQPAASTTVTVARTAGDTDLTVSGGATLTFTTANWATPQTVTLAAAQDTDLAAGSATIAVSSSGLGTQTVTATEVDEDTQALVVSTAAVTVNEGSTATFTVRLAFQPAATTTVNVARTAGDGDITVSGGATLTFTTANWATAQTATLAAAEDADAINGSAIITVSASGIASQTVAATEADNDTQAIVLSATTATVPEGGSATVGVSLAADPLGSVTVTAAFAAGDADITVAGGASLTFTSANWSVPQTVTLAAAEDADTAEGTASITVASAGLTTRTIAATEADNDTQGLVVSAGSATVPEGGTASFTVRLNAQPAVSVTVSVNRTAGDSDIVVQSGAALTFTTANWSTPQTVTLAAAQDADTANGSATITIASTGLTSQTVAAIESDDDTQALQVSTAALTVAEGGTATFTVRLAFQPAATTVVTVARTAGDSDIQVATGLSLSFTTANWATAQTVTLAAAEDVDTTAGSATITVSSTGLSSVAVTVTEIDNDALALQVSATAVTVPEAGTAAFTVRLNSQPPGDTTVLVARTAGDADISVQSGASLTFTTVNWATPQTVMLAAAADDDAVNGSATIAVTAAGLADALIAATEADDDTLAIAASLGAVQVPEGGTAAFTVALTAAPSAPLTVQVARSAGDADLAVAGGAVLVFTAADWDVGQTVTLVAADDADLADGAATISCTATGLAQVDIAASENDDDTQAIVLSTGAVTVPEGGTATVTARLAYQPAGDTVVSVAQTAGDSDITVQSGASLTFTTANWATAQTVTLAAAQDTDLAAGTATITASSAAAASQALTATEADDDTQAIVLSTAALTVPEGRTATVSVSLAYQPAADTVVSAARTAGDSDITVSGGASLTFTSANWATPQTVTIAAAQDADGLAGTATVSVSAAGMTTMQIAVTEADDDIPTAILSSSTITVPEGGTAGLTVALSAQPAADTTMTVAIASGDADLTVSAGGTLVFTTANWATPQAVTLAAAQDADAVNGTATLAVTGSGLLAQSATATETDDDTQAIVVAGTLLFVAEGGTGNITVTLAAEPVAPVTITAAWLSGDSDITVSGAGTAVFTAADWSTPKTIAVAAAEDADLVNGSAVIRLSGGGLTAVDVAVNEADNDTQALVVAPSTVSVPEASTASFTVRLAFQPAADTTVTATWASGDTDITVSSGATLTFTTANWATPQQVVLAAAADDGDTVDGTAVIIVASAGLADVPVTANEVDDDVLALVVSSSALTITEGGSAAFTVRLTQMPAATTNVTVARTLGDADISIPVGATLAFTTANWSVPQTVIVAAAEDADGLDGSATITVASSGMTSRTLTATESDNDLAGIIASASGVSVPEGSSAAFTVRLAAQPPGDTTVLVTRTAGDTDIGVAAGAAIFFTTTNWNVPQQAVLAAAEDADAANGVATIGLSAGGLADVPVMASEADNDSIATLKIGGGGAGSGGGCGLGGMSGLLAGAALLLLLRLRRSGR